MEVGFNRYVGAFIPIKGTSSHEGICRIGGVFGTRFSIWDLSNMRGGKPAITAQGTLDGAYRFRFVYFVSFLLCRAQVALLGGVAHTQNTLASQRNRQREVR